MLYNTSFDAPWRVKSNDVRIVPLSILDQKLLITEKLSKMKTNNFSSVTSGDLAFDLTEKMTKVVSYWFLTLSNAVYRWSLRRSGVELDGGRKTATPGPLCYKRWAPARRGLIENVVSSIKLFAVAATNQSNRTTRGTCFDILRYCLQHWPY